jgi:hypothetical protein
LCAIPLYYQFLGPNGVHGAVQKPNTFVSDLETFFVPTLQILTPDWARVTAAHWTGNAAEASAYLSIPGLTLLAGIVVALRRNSIVILSAAMLAISALLSMGPHLHINGQDTGIKLPWVFIDHLPIFQSILPGRMAMYVFLFAAVLVAVGFDAALRTRSRLPISLVSVPLLAMLIALVPTFPSVAASHPIPSFFTSSAVNIVPQGSVALVLPWPDGASAPVVGTDSVSMLWQASSGMRFRMPSGDYLVPGLHGEPTFGVQTTRYTGLILAAAYQGVRLPDPTDPTVRSRVKDDFAYWHLATVIVGPMPGRQMVTEWLTEILGAQPQDIGGVSVWSGVRP